MANGNRLEIGHSFQALYHNVGELATEGTAVVSGCSPSASATRDWGVDVTAGTVSRSWEFTDLEDTVVIVDAPHDTYDRKDVIVWDGNDYRVVKGDAVAHSSRQTNGEARFELIRPEPDALATNDWVPIAEVFVATGATEITDADIHGLTEDPLPKGVPDDTKFYLGTDREYSIRRDSDSGEVILVDEQNGHEWKWNHDGAGGLKFPGELAAESADVDSASVDSLDASVDTAVPLEIGPFELFSDGGDLIIHAPWTGHSWRFDGNDGGLESADISSLDLESLSLTDLDVDNFAAAMELVAPRYDSTSAAPDKTGMIIVVPASGSDTAGAYIHNGNGYQLLDESGGVSAGSLSGLTIDADKDWGGHHIENVGKDGVRVPSSVKRTVDDYNAGSINDGYTGHTSSASVQSSVVKEGSYALQLDNSGTAKTIYNLSGLDTYPQVGDQINVSVYLADGNTAFQPFFGVQTESGMPDGYAANVYAGDDEFQLFKVEGGTVTTLKATAAPVSSHLNEWLDVTIEWADDGIEAVLRTQSGTKLGEVTTSDTTYKSGGIAYRHYNNQTDATAYADAYTVVRRTREYLTDTQRGTTELGNEVRPSGGIATGPQEAPPNAERTVRTVAPVNADATQGTQAELRDEIAGVPSGRYRYTHDGQGGAYGSRFDAALGRVARINSNLSWEYNTLTDISHWSVDGATTSFTTSLTGRPRRLHLSMDGTNSGSWAGFLSSVLTTFESLGAFRITFKDVSFTDNADETDVHLGFHDHRDLSNDLESVGNGVIFTYEEGSPATRFRKIESGASSHFGYRTTDWSVNHDVSVEYDGSTVRGVIDGEVTGEASFSVASDFSPVIQMQDEGVGETLEVEQVIVEALE